MFCRFAVPRPHTFEQRSRLHSKLCGGKAREHRQTALNKQSGKQNNIPPEVQPPNLSTLQEERMNFPGVTSNIPHITGLVAPRAELPGSQGIACCLGTLLFHWEAYGYLNNRNATSHPAAALEPPGKPPRL